MSDLRVSDDAIKMWLLIGLWAALIFGVLAAVSGALSGAAGFLLSKKSDRAIAEAHASAEHAQSVAALANERTAEATLALEQLRRDMSWREFTSDQRETLLKKFTSFNYPITINWTSGDIESSNFAKQFQEVFRAAGVTVTVSPLFGGQPPYGLTVAGNPVLVDKTMEALVSAGFWATLMPSSDLSGLQLFIGPKEPVNKTP